MTVDTIAQGGALTQRPAHDPLAGWLAAAGDAQALAQGLVRSYFVPQAYKPNPREEGAYDTAVANATGAILLGRSLGLDPLTSLQQIYVVHGRPGMYTKLKVALAQAAGHRVWDEVYGPERAVVCGQRKGTDDVVRIEITMDMAEKAGWTDSAMYRKTPADMLWARAASRVVDRIAADLLMGVRSIEDIEADDVPAAPIERPRASAILAAAAPAEREAAPVAAVEPERPAQMAEPDPVTRAVLPVTDAQLRKLGAVFGDLGVKGRGERADRLAIASRIAGRTLASSKELTLDEARTLIDTLEANGPAIAAEVLGWTDETAAPVVEPAGDEAPAADVDVQDPPANPEGW